MVEETKQYDLLPQRYASHHPFCETSRYQEPESMVALIL